MGALAAILSGLALVDPRLKALAWVGLTLAALTLFRDRRRAFLPLLALCFITLNRTGFSVGADSLVDPRGSRP